MKFIDELRNWVLTYHISHRACDHLLAILRQHGFEKLPQDSRTLLKTPQNVNIVNIGSGQY